MPEWSDEPEIPLKELIDHRLNLIRDSDPNLHLGEKKLEGSSAIVIDCTYGEDATSLVLKLSKVREGIQRNEVDAYSYLHSVRGIPRLIKDYHSSQERGATIALLVEKITGTSIDNFIQKNPRSAYDVIMNMYEITKAVHAKGFRMPADQMNTGNWLVTPDGIPHLVDLGEAHLMGNSNEEVLRCLREDWLTFNSRLEKYQHLFGWLKRRKIRKLVDAEFSQILQLGGY